MISCYFAIYLWKLSIRWIAGLTITNNAHISWAFYSIFFVRGMFFWPIISMAEIPINSVTSSGWFEELQESNQVLGNRMRRASTKALNLLLKNLRQLVP